MRAHMSEAKTLPTDFGVASLAGRVWRPDVAGPSVVAIRSEGVFDISTTTPTMRDLCERTDAVALVKSAAGKALGPLEAILANTPEATRDTSKPWLLAPNDLQAIKAAGVTFPRSMLERVIEEKAQGDPQAATAIRAEILARFGGDLKRMKPGSVEAAALKRTLITAGAWSQYLEVAIGPDAEIFTKAQPMAAVGHGMSAGLDKSSAWNNPEPEVVLCVNSRAQIVGATLGNDVNLRDVEGRSALLLSKAKDNNASAAIGPFIRFFDGHFMLDTVRQLDVHLTVAGHDGFHLTGRSSMAEIARDPADLVAQMMGDSHHYPDGAMLYLGTMFAPTEDRGAKGQGFTHKLGDIVTVHASALGALTNLMTTSDQAPAWDFGASHLMRNLSQRGVI